MNSKKILTLSLLLICIFVNLAFADELSFKLNITSAVNPYPLREGKYTFNVDGNIKIQNLGSGNTTGLSSFDVTVPANSSSPDNIELLDFPSDYGTMGIVKQSYDKANKVLNVQISRNVILFAQHLDSNIGFDNIALGPARIDGLSLGLYDSANNLVMKSKVLPNFYNNLQFTAVVPGTYTIKVLDAPEDIKEKYDLSKTFKLKVEDNAKTTLDGHGPLGVDASQGPYIDGIKTPFQIWFSSIPSLDKNVSNATKDAGVFAKAVKAKTGDIVEFKIDRQIKADHNFELGLKNFMKFASKINIEFYDDIPNGLEYVDGTLKILENNAPATDFVGRYENHKIIVSHNSTVNNIPLPFSGKIKIPIDRNISIVFKCKVLDNFNSDIVNNAYGNGKKSSAKVIPEPTPTPTPTPKVLIPQTGDGSDVFAYTLIALVCFAGVIYMLYRNKKK